MPLSLALRKGDLASYHGSEALVSLTWLCHVTNTHSVMSSSTYTIIQCPWLPTRSCLKKQKLKEGSGEMAHQFRALAALPEDLRFNSQHYSQQLPVNFRFRTSNSLYWLPWVLHEPTTFTYMEANTYIS